MMIYPIIIVAVIAVDQLSKYLIRINFNIGDRLPIIGDWFNITFVQNTGTAFSMFAGNKFVTIGLTTVLLIICIIAIINEVRSGSKFLALCLTAVLAGGLSNMIDRFVLGYVTDMISVGSFAVFNVADMFITCGCILAMINVLLSFRKEYRDEHK